MRSSIPDDGKIILMALVILAVIGVAAVVDYLHWSYWYVAAAAGIGAVIVWRLLRQED